MLCAMWSFAHDYLDCQNSSRVSTTSTGPRALRAVVSACTCCRLYGLWHRTCKDGEVVDDKVRPLLFIFKAHNTLVQAAFSIGPSHNSRVLRHYTRHGHFYSVKYSASGEKRSCAKSTGTPTQSKNTKTMEANCGSAFSDCTTSIWAYALSPMIPTGIGPKLPL